MPIQKWQKLDDKIPDFLEPMPEELIKAKEILGEDFPLFEKIRTGTPEERQEARNRLTAKHKGLVYQLANRFYSLLSYHPIDRAIEWDDLVQEGMIGLMRAFETYDYTKGFRFSVYAFYWIRQFILRSYQDRAFPVRIPIHIQEKIRKIEKITDSLQIKLKRKPSRKEIAEAARITLEELENTIEKSRVFQHMLSLDAPVEESGDGKELSLSGLAESKENFEEIFEKKEISAEFKKKIQKIFWLAELNPREQYFLERFFGLDGGEREVLEKIAKRQRITRERVRQIIEKGLTKLQIPEVNKLVKNIFPEIKISELTPSHLWTKVFELLKAVIDQEKEKEEWSSDSLLETTASYFGFGPEELKKPSRKEVIKVAQSTAIFLLYKVGGLSKSQIRSFMNIKEATIEVSLAKFHEELKLWEQGLLAELQRISQNMRINGNFRNFRLRKQWDKRREEVLETILNHPEMTYDEIGKLLGVTGAMVKLRARQIEVKRGHGRRTSGKEISRNQEILLTVKLNPNFSYKKIGELFNLSEAYISKLVREQGFRRFKGWQGWRPNSQKTKPMDDKKRATRNQKILEMMKNNPKLSYHQIGKIFNLHHTSIGKIASDAGIVHEVKGGMPKKITFEKVWPLFQKKKNLEKVAEALNCDVQTVRKRLKEEGKIKASRSR